MTRRSIPSFEGNVTERPTGGVRRGVPAPVTSPRAPVRATRKVELIEDDTSEVQKGVSLPFLQRAFKIGRATINRKLANLAPIGTGLHNTPLYDLAEAASYLAEPRINIDEYLQTVGPAKLPEKSREAYWSSKLKEQRFRTQAAELWHTDSVIMSVGNLFKELRQRMQLLPGDIATQLTLSMADKKKIIAIVDMVQADMTELVQKFGDKEELVNEVVREDRGELDGDE